MFLADPLAANCKGREGGRGHAKPKPIPDSLTLIARPRPGPPTSEAEDGSLVVLSATVDIVVLFQA